MVTTDVVKALAEVVGPAHMARADQLEAYAVDGVTPRAAVFPADAAQVQAVVKRAAEEGLAITARGGGTAMAAGARPERLDVVLGTRRLKGILEYEPADLTATVQAGVTLAELSSALGRHGQMLPLEAPHPSHATIGGVLAANSSGPRRLAYGAPRDRVLGLRVVDARGVVIKGGGKVVKNVAGYDLPKLFIGSLGTLGVIIEASFKLAPAPSARSAVLAGFRTLEEALETAGALLREGIRPQALDLLNARAMRELSTLTGLPGFSDRLYALALDLGGAKAAVERQQGQAHRVMAKAGGKPALVDGPVPYEGLWNAVVDLGRVVDRPASMMTKTSVLFSRMGQTVHGLEALAESSHLEAAVDASASGVLRAAWWGEGGGPADERMLAEAVATLRTAAGHVGGTLVVESCAPSLKAVVDVWGPPGPELAIMRRLKERFDPHRLLSPGRFVGGL